MKKLLLLGIITLTALFTACEKDKPEDYSSTFGLNTSTLDINDPNLYYWKYTYSTNCECGENYTTCVPGTNKFIIEDLIPYFKEEVEAGEKHGYTIKITNLSKITEEECESLWQ